MNNFSGVSLFSALGQNAVIKDLTLENLSVEFTVNKTGAMQANYLFASLHEQAKIENFAVSGENSAFKLTVKSSVELQVDFETAWQYGSSANGQIVNLTVDATKELRII